jgi:hypothetical protein
MLWLLQVEFQRNYRVTVRVHMEALVAKRTFWETLLHNNVTFDKLADAVESIEKTVKAAEQTYKQVLHRHSSSHKILVLYVKFLQVVRNGERVTAAGPGGSIQGAAPSTATAAQTLGMLPGGQLRPRSCRSQRRRPTSGGLSFQHAHTCLLNR